MTAPIPPKKSNQWLYVLIAIGFMWLIGSLIGKTSDTPDTPTTDDSSYSVDSVDSGPSEEAQIVALQAAVEEMNASGGMSICQSISVLGRTGAVDTVMESSDYVFDRSVVEDFLQGECP